MTEDLYTTKRSLELEWQQEHLKEGNIILTCPILIKKFRKLLKRSLLKEFEEATLTN